MKKIGILIVLLLILTCTGCDFSKDDVNDITNNLFDNFEDLQNGQVVEGSYGQFRNINVDASYLGYGYDIINDEYIKKDYINVSAPIIDLDKIEQAKLKMIKENNVEKIEVQAENMMDFMLRYNEAMKVYGKAGKFFSGGLSMDFSGSVSAKMYYKFYKNILNVRTFNLYLTNSINELKELLSEEFKKDLLTMHPEALFNKYGTHMLKEVSMGGRIEISSQYASASVGATAEVNMAINTHINALKRGNVNSEEMSSLELELFAKNIECYYNVKQVGGALTNINSLDKLNEKSDEWLKSFDENVNYSALSGIVGENSLVPLWDLLPNGNTERREELYNAFEELSGDAFESLCENFKINTKRTLTVEVDGTGKINEYAYEHKDGDEVTLVATPDADSRFMGWYDGDQLVSNSLTYTFNIHVNTALVAKFRKLNDDSCLLVVHISGYGDVSGNEQQIYKIGDEIMLTANPAHNNQFEGWFVNNVCVSTNTFYTFNIKEDTTVVAKFTNNEVEKCLLVVNTIGAGKGTVTWEKIHDMRSIATVKAEAEKGYVFVGWYLENEEVSTNPEYAFIIDKDIILFAKFEVLAEEEYTIKTSVYPNDYGTISGADGSFKKGALVTLMATPKDGYTFKEWKINNETIASNPYSFPINEHMNVTAIFESQDENVYTLSYILNNEEYGIPVDFEEVSIEVLEKTIPVLKVPCSEYLIFQGWYINGEIKICDSEGNLSKNIDNYTDSYGRWLGKDCNLEAKWELNLDYEYISTKEELNKIRDNVSGKYVLVGDINLNGEEWTPITEFKGFLEGNNYSIYNYQVDKSGKGNANIGFINLNSGTIQNLKIGKKECTTFDSKYSVKYDVSYEENSKRCNLYVGGFAGQNGGEIINCELVNVYMYAEYKDKDNNEALFLHLGGICGQNNTNAKMSNCVVFDSNLKGYCPSASNSGDDNYGLLGGISALNRGLIENVIVKNTTLYLDVRGDGDGGLLEKDNKAYPRVYIGEILAENVAGTLKGYSYSDTDVSYYISSGKYTDSSHVYDNAGVGRVTSGTVSK